MNIQLLSDIQESKIVSKSTDNINHIKLKLQAQSILLQRGFEELICLDDINIKPEPWQLESALTTLHDMNGSSILADEVGLGKTIECGLILKELLVRGLAHTILILVPAPLVEQWIQEMRDKFNIELKNIKDKDWEEHDLLICSMPLAVRSKQIKDKLFQKTFDIVVVDEAHCLKNNKTANYKFVYNLSKKNIVLMSATPIQNDLMELYNLANILKPGVFMSRRLFREKYLQNKFTPKNVEELKNLLNSIMIRHRRSNTLVELPRRKVHNLKIDMEYDEKKFFNGVIFFCKEIYQQYVEEKRVKLSKGDVPIIILILLSLLKQNSSSPHSVVKTLETKMIPRLSNEDDIEYCRDLIKLGKTIPYTSKAKQLIQMVKQDDNQYLVYSEYRTTIQMLKEQLESQGIATTVYHGGLNSKEKQRAIEEFKSGMTKVFVSSESGGQGLNLQFCSKLINYDLPWNPMRIEQRIGRVHRFGQKNNVDIYTITLAGTIDEYILFILTAKLNLFEMVIGELDTIMSYMLKNETPIEVQIGNIILGSVTPSEIEEKLKMLGDIMLQAKTEFNQDAEKGKEILNKIGVGK